MHEHLQYVMLIFMFLIVIDDTPRMCVILRERLSDVHHLAG